ncbi:M67 family metallopeptidase [Paenibacillus arenilitoris]|uniref:M67 family metallopeptidase n=1 Tax=Paenibacillus arenilitoris TaxID=2772299 RepID=A0A927CVX0_9BACL|nr:M67 family metallopeptidase [Paenibacillus arenilitoris]MBD2872801.1 M67 family metallopeptidase [Paenibacillus arenilitoris]
MTERYSKMFMTKEAYDRLIRLCKDAFPAEACGVLACGMAEEVDDDPSGAACVIDAVIPIRNAHDRPDRSFSFDPAEWTAAYYDMQINRQNLVGLFHSHPRSEAVPSISDAEGFLPAFALSYWIVSLQNKEAPHVQPYRRSQGAFIPLELVIA